MIRLATAGDAAEILEIYRPSIEQSSVSFETAVPSVDDMRGRIEACLEKYPWIVAASPDKVQGYAYGGPYHTRAAYCWSAIVSVYVADDALRQGIAGRLYRGLFALLKRQGIRQVLAAITVPNPASQQFHESLGFRQVGLMPDVGFKLDQWQSMGWWQRSIGAGAAGKPTDFVPFHKLAPGLSGDLTNLASEGE